MQKHGQVCNNGCRSWKQPWQSTSASSGKRHLHAVTTRCVGDITNSSHLHPLSHQTIQVRFFERRKLTRALHKLQASIWGGHPTAAQARQLQQLQADLQYVMHFPRGEKYVSLLIKANTPEARAVQEQERTRLRALVAKQLAEKAVLTEANEGQNIDRGDVAKEQPVKSLLGPETEMISTDEHDDADSSDAEDGLPETDALPLGTQNAMHAARYDGSSTKAGRASSEVHVPVKTRAASMQNPAHAAHQLLSATGQGSADFDDDFFLADDANPGTSALPPPLQLPKQMTEGAMPKKRQQTVHGNKGVKDNKRRHTKLGVHHGKEENGHQVNTKSTSTPKQAKQVAKQEQPVRSRAEGGRKRRKKKE